MLGESVQIVKWVGDLVVLHQSFSARPCWFCLGVVT